MDQQILRRMTKEHMLQVDTVFCEDFDNFTQKIIAFITVRPKLITKWEIIQV